MKNPIFFSYSSSPSTIHKINTIFFTKRNAIWKHEVVLSRTSFFTVNYVAFSKNFEHKLYTLESWPHPTGAPFYLLRNSICHTFSFFYLLTFYIYHIQPLISAEQNTEHYTLVVVWAILLMPFISCNWVQWQSGKGL